MRTNVRWALILSVLTIGAMGVAAFQDRFNLAVILGGVLVVDLLVLRFKDPWPE